MNVMKQLMLLPALLFVSQAAMAEGTLYKSVDQKGNVTYSDSPPKDAVVSKPVAVDPGPSADQVRAAEKRVRAMEEKAEEMARERAQRPVEKPQLEPAPVPVDGSAEDESIVTTDEGRIRDKVLQRVPNESPGGGQHPIYNPGLPAQLPAIR